MRISIELAARNGPALFAWFVRRSLEGIVAVNRAAIRRGLVGPLYRSKVRYRDEPAGRETFRDALLVALLGYGDCAHLAAWRVAELQEAGEKAGLVIKWAKPHNNKRLFHVVVRRANGRIEDPSRKLGMP